jgi:hypothetical protein
VETAGTLELADLGIDSENVSQGTWYQAISERVFRALMSQIPIDHEHFIFVDVGSGKGRALLLASHYAFLRVVGVEFSEILHKGALVNFSRYRSPHEQRAIPESVCMDAAVYPWPELPTLAFLYSPFKPALMRAVLDNLLNSLALQPRPFLILFYGTNPESLAMLQGLPGFMATELRVPRDYTKDVTRRGLLVANRKLPLSSSAVASTPQ